MFGRRNRLPRDLEAETRPELGPELGPELTPELGPELGLGLGPEPEPDPEPETSLDIDLTKQNIPGKVQLYNDLLEGLCCSTCKTKHRLDFHQQRLHKHNSAIQMSVIYLSAISSLLQALSSSTYDVIFPETTTDPVTNITDTIEGEIDQSTYSELVPILTLIISTYSSLIISFARHFKIEEKEGNISNLRDRFAELISRIKHQIDLIKPWSDEDYYLIDTNKDKKHEWTGLLKRIDKEYNHIVDIRKELYINYNKLVNTGVLKKYDSKVEEDIDIFDDKHPKEKHPKENPRVPSRGAPTYYT